MKLLSFLLALSAAVVLAAPSLRNVEGGYGSNVLGATSPFGVRGQIENNEGKRIRINEVSLRGVTGDLRNIDTSGCALSINGNVVPATVALEGENINFTPQGEVFVEGNKPVDVGCMGVNISGRSGTRRSFLVIRHDDGKKLESGFKYGVAKRGSIGGRTREDNGINFDPATGTLRAASRNFNIDVDNGRLQWQLSKEMNLEAAQCQFAVANGTPVPAVVDTKENTITMDGVTVNADQPAELTCSGVKYHSGRGKRRGRGTLRWLGGKTDKNGKQQTLAEQKATVCENKFCSAAPALGVSTLATGALAVAAAALSFVL